MMWVRETRMKMIQPVRFYDLSMMFVQKNNALEILWLNYHFG